MWLCALDLALAHGWRPQGTDPPEASYVTPRDQRVSKSDAMDLARCLSAGLPTVSGSTVPLTDQPFGDSRTSALIADAMQGNAPTRQRAAAARELLSGAPKTETAVLARFLEAGGFAISKGA
jgi:hypothetical protein